MSALVSKLAVVTAAAVGLYVTTVGLSVTPHSCLRTVGVTAAAPSPTCGADERECLHASVKTGLYGVRYVSPEDVARCVEAFNACIHGTLQGNPNSPSSTSGAGGGNKTTLPKHFGIDSGDGNVSDCRISGDTVSCTDSWETGTDSYTGEFTGKISGLTMTGTTTTHRTGTSPDGCTINETYLGPVTYVFSPDGGVTFTAGPNQRQTTLSGSCSGSSSGMTEVMEGTARWSKIE